MYGRRENAVIIVESLAGRLDTGQPGMRNQTAPAPGNRLDVFARLVGSRMGDSRGQPLVAETRSGAAGNAAGDAVVKVAGIKVD
jgi:tripartite-type tricarboxylate transporter receptor subunit TctC